MKLVFVIDELAYGGAQRVISIVANAMAELGHEVHILKFYNRDNEYQASDKVRVTCIKNTYEEYAKTSKLYGIKFIRSFLKQINPEIAVGFQAGGYALYLSSIGLGIKRVASVRNDPRMYFASKGIRGAINKLWFKSADAVVVQTNMQKEMCKSYPWKNIHVIPNPISENIMSYKQHNYLTNYKINKIVMVGRLAPQKNYQMIIEAIKEIKRRHPDIQLDIYGTGELEQELKDKIQELGLEDTIKLKGWTNDVLNQINSHDLYILSSDYEGLPNALMEAMGIGMICISTDCKHELIDNGINGFLVPIGDSKSMEDCITNILSLPANDLSAIGESARKKIIDNFNTEYIISQWEKLFEDLILIKGRKH